MPRILPTRYFPESTNNPSDAEGEIFDRFLNDKTIDDWWILHSYHIVDHVVQKEGEVDFLILIPSLGIVTVEVKGHRDIKYKNGLWYFNNNIEPEKKSPLTQSKENMWSMIDLIKKSDKKPSGFIKIPWTHICIFPFSKFNFNSPEWFDWQIIDADKLNKKPLPELISSALHSQIEIENSDNLSIERIDTAISEQDKKRYQNKRSKIKNSISFPPNDIEKIIKILRPNIDSTQETKHQRIERINNEIETFTPEQENVLEWASNNNNFLVTGPAGSGKTVLATEICNIFSQDSNLKILYLCFNRGLMLYLKNKFKDRKFEIQTFYGLLHNLTSTENTLSVKDLDESFYDNLIDYAMDSLLVSNKKYDVVVIDEFQDLAIEKNMYFFDRLLTGGFASGRWYFFGDFEKQNLFQNNVSRKDILKEIGYNHFELTLRSNCRNTPDVAEEIETYVKLNPAYRRPFIRSNGIVEPVFINYSDEDEQLRNLQDSIDELIELGYDKGEILILSPLSKNSISRRLNEKNLKYKLYEYNYEKNLQDEPGPYFSTIYKHKGLEFNVIILTDISSHSYFSSVNEELIALIYTGLTRSLETFVMHIDKKLIDAGLI